MNLNFAKWSYNIEKVVPAQIVLYFRRQLLARRYLPAAIKVRVMNNAI
jgi:hypothetical protein